LINNVKDPSVKRINSHFKKDKTVAKKTGVSMEKRWIAEED
jgi:hypothetical protein